MWTIIIVLIATGLLMVLLEILVIPGGGFAGILGFALMAVGVFLTFSREGTQAGLFVMGGTIVLNVSALVLALRSKTWDRAMLKKEVDGRVNTIDGDLIKPGDQGVTVSRCAPIGKAMIHDEFYEVHARSAFIDENTEIEVIRIEGNKIFIKQKNH